ncbi:MAG: ferredoxin [Calditrichaceae bacterium]
MKFIIEDMKCRGCGVCERACPQVFKMCNDMSVKIRMTSVPAELVQCALNAENICPLKIISHQ